MKHLMAAKRLAELNERREQMRLHEEVMRACWNRIMRHAAYGHGGALLELLRANPGLVESFRVPNPAPVAVVENKRMWWPSDVELHDQKDAT
jgi:hypothetical protein